MADPREIEVTLVKSIIGTPAKHRRVIKALGLYRLNQSVRHFENAVISGMVRKISHLINVEVVS